MDFNQAQPSTDGDAMSNQGVDVLRLAVSSGKYMAASILACLILAWMFLFFAQARYEAQALVQIEETSPSLGTAITQVQDVFDPASKVADEKEIIGSRAVLVPVIEELNLRDFVEPNYFPLFGRAIARKQLAIGRLLNGLPYFGSFAWAGDKLSIGNFTVPASLEDQRLTIVADGNGGYSILAKDSGWRAQGKIGELLEAPVGDGVLSLFVKEIQADKGTRFTIAKRRLVSSIDTLSQQLNVAELSRNSNLLNVTIDDTDPALAAQKANLIADFYLRQNVERRSEEAQKTLEFLKQEVPDIRDRLHAAEEQLRKFRVDRKSVDITLETGQLLQQQSGLALQRLTLTQKRTELRQRFTDTHPDIVALNQQIAEVDGQLGSMRTKADTLPETQQNLLRLTLDAKVQDEFYVNLLNNIQQLEVAKAGKIGNIRIIDRALTPPLSFFPKPLLIYPAGLVAGILLGLLISIGAMLLDRNEHDPIVVERIIGVPVFAQVPLSRTLRGSAAEGEAQRLLAVTASDDPAVESLRSLRATLHFASVGAANNVVMITGPKPGVGKTFITANLGYLLGISGKKVLLIDGDLRRGRLHSYFGFERGPGLSNVLAGGSLEASVHAIDGGNLFCMTSGDLPPNPGELLLHERFTQMLEQVSPSFDYVLIDSPPVLAVGDAGIIGHLAGTTLIVAKSGSHTARELIQTMKMLAQAGARVRGAVINQVVRGGAAYGYYYHYEYRRDGKKKKGANV